MTRDDPSDFGVVRYWYTTFSPFPMKLNVHEYPEHATERELLQYKIAVEQAALDGQPIEVKPRFPSRSADGWRQVHTAPDDLPSFNWCTMCYRVARPKIAEGHNPAGVTEDQIPAGWRLFSKEEREVLGLKTLGDTRYWLGSRWSDRTFCCLFDSRYGTVITQKPAGFYLPKIVAGHNPHALTEEQVGVKDGYRLLTADEIRHRDTVTTGLDREIERWWESRGHWDTSGWNGSGLLYTYRTKKPAGFYLPQVKIAEGHNPDRLTEDQVGVRDGYRLLTADEIKGPKQAGVEYWETDTPGWAEAKSPAVHFDGVSYRTKAAPGEYLPKPKPVQPTTVLGWLNTLPAGYRERALKNRRPDDDDLGCSRLGLALLYLPWLGSPEGTQFWSDVYEAVIRGEAFPPLPEAPKKLVPWTLETFVWPDCVRPRDMVVPRIRSINEARTIGVFVDSNFLSWDQLAEFYEYSIDHGLTWRRCGREEVAS